MRKRYFLIPLTAIIIASFLVWACKHPWGPGIAGISDVINSGGGVPPKGWYMNEKGGPGYKGNVAEEVTNTLIASSKMQGRGIELWKKQSGNNFYRIPTLMQLTNGDLLAFADRRIGSIGDLPNKIEIVMKRSADNGKNWSDEQRISPQCTSIENSYGDAGFILDRKTGNIICVTVSGPGFVKTKQNPNNFSTPDKPARISIIKSKDNGHNWDSPVDITSQIYGHTCKNLTRKNWHAAFASSGNGVQLRNGRMLFVLNVREGSEFFVKNYVMYSDDGGDTWNVSKNAPENSSSSGGNEAKIVELNNGDLLMAIRPGLPYQRRLAKSTNSGVTWGVAVARADLPSSSSNGDIIYYTSTLNGWDKDRIITMFDSVPYTDSTPPADPIMYYSYDEGNNWKGLKTFTSKAGYSSLAILNDGSIGMLLEFDSWSGPIWFTRINMKALTSNEDNGPFKKGS